MTAQINVYWSFRSPYSYLATPGALQLVADFDAEVQFRAAEGWNLLPTYRG